MQLIYDNLVAVLVSALLLTVVMTIKMRTQETAIDATRFHAAKSRQAQFVDLLEYDLEELGSGVPTGEPMIHAYSTDSLGLECIEFEKQFADGELGRIRYKRWHAGSYVDGDTTLRLVEFIRLVEATDGSFVYSGGSGRTVLRLDLELLDKDGQPATDNMNGTDRIDVALESVMPFALSGQGARERSAVHRMNWQSTFRPSNLARRSDGSGGSDQGC